ncbi:MAG: hypothetical protein ACLR8Y_13630 [Alistipes indistinctus]
MIQATGKVVERASKNTKIPTGEVEVVLDSLKVLNAANTALHDRRQQRRRR